MIFWVARFFSILGNLFFGPGGSGDVSKAPWTKESFSIDYCAFQKMNFSYIPIHYTIIK